MPQGRPADSIGIDLALRRLSILLRRASVGFDVARQRGRLRGRRVSRDVDGARVGCFIGFVADRRAWPDDMLEPPEAVVSVFVDPAGSRLHRRLVARPNSLFQRVHREARRRDVPFDFRRDRVAALVRHRSVRGMPPEILALTALDFFTTSMRGLWAADFFDRIRALRRGPSRGRR